MMRQFRLSGALHPSAIGDGFVTPIFVAEDRDDDATYVQRSDSDAVDGFVEIELSDDDVVLQTNSQRQITIGDRPLGGFQSRARGLLIGNVYYLREALAALRDDYPPGSGCRRQIDRFLSAGTVLGERTIVESEPGVANPEDIAEALDGAPGVEVQPDVARRATFVAEPLERGYGLTLGNALRRVLLSSLTGAAVTAIRIDGVLHEFSPLAGVREDVTELVLAVKQIALRMRGAGPKTLRLSAVGPAEVRAGDIEVPGGVEVMNADLALCRLDEGARLVMELTAEVGKGYVPATANRPADAPLGLIPIDALYSPVRQVSYKVDPTRVGGDLDYDRLTITVETDGTVSPEDAVGQAARILQDQLELFAAPDGVGAAGPRSLVRLDGESLVGADRLLLKSVAELELSSLTARAFERHGILHVGDIVRKSGDELLRVLGGSRKSLGEIEEVVSSLGLRLGMKLPEWEGDRPKTPFWIPRLAGAV